MKCASEMCATAATARTSSGSAYARSMASRARSRRRLRSSASRLTQERYVMGARSANAGPRNAGILTAENGLHGDHCGGNRLSPGTPIYVQRRELDDACSDESWRRLSPLAEAVDVVPSISRDREPVTPRETRNT